MSELKKSENISIHPFQPLHPDIRPELNESSDRNAVSTEPRLYKTIKGESNFIIVQYYMAKQSQSVIFAP